MTKKLPHKILEPHIDKLAAIDSRAAKILRNSIRNYEQNFDQITATSWFIEHGEIDFQCEVDRLDEFRKSDLQLRKEILEGLKKVIPEKQATIVLNRYLSKVTNQYRIP